MCTGSWTTCRRRRCSRTRRSPHSPSTSADSPSDSRPKIRIADRAATTGAVSRAHTHAGRHRERRVLFRRRSPREERRLARQVAFPETRRASPRSRVEARRTRRSAKKRAPGKAPKFAHFVYNHVRIIVSVHREGSQQAGSQLVRKTENKQAGLSLSLSRLRRRSERPARERLSTLGFTKLAFRKLSFVGKTKTKRALDFPRHCGAEASAGILFSNSKQTTQARARSRVSESSADASVQRQYSKKFR